MKLNDQPVGDGQHLILYHGTSTARFKSILAENRLGTSRYLELLGAHPSISPWKVALTTERSVADYWADVAVWTDRFHRSTEHDRFSHDGSGVGVVLKLDGERMVELGYDLKHFREYDWENEIACWEDIDPLNEVLIAIEPAVEPISPEMVELLEESPPPPQAPAALRRCRRRVAKRLGHDTPPLKEVTALRRAIIHGG
jgi:hypothetical protein